MKIDVASPPGLFVIVEDARGEVPGPVVPVLVTDSMDTARRELTASALPPLRIRAVYAVSDDGKAMLLQGIATNIKGDVFSLDTADGGPERVLQAARDAARDVFIRGSQVWGPQKF